MSKSVKIVTLFVILLVAGSASFFVISRIQNEKKLASQGEQIEASRLKLTEAQQKLFNAQKQI